MVVLTRATHVVKRHVASSLVPGMMRVLFFLMLGGFADFLHAEDKVYFTIPQGSAQVTLMTYAKQAERQVLYPYKTVRDYKTNKVEGRYSADEALVLLLKNTGLEATTDSSGYLMIRLLHPDNNVGEAPVEKLTQLNTRRSFVGTKLAAALVSIFGVSEVALAQNANPSPVGIEEIIVTAQRREQNLQSTPIAITALTAGALENSGINSTEELSMVVPGLQLVQVSNAVTPYLRGVGTQNAGPGMEPSIATYVDGVYFGSVGGNVFALNNIERIEVLKGPQGTLFGRNATGGLIHVITKDPEHDPSATVSLGYGNYETTKASFYGTTGLSDAMAADLALNFTDQNEGWGRNITTGKEVNLREDQSARSRISWDFTDKFNALVAVDYNKWDSDIGINSNALPGARLLDGQSIIGSIYDVRSNAVPDGHVEQWGVSLRASYDFGWGALTSTTATRDYKSFSIIDLDRTALPLFQARLEQEMETFQQEFILNGEADALDYTVGIIYYNSEAGWGPQAIRSAVGAANTDLNSLQETDSYAAFAQGTYKLTGDTGLTLGLRYTEDERSIWGTRLAVAPHPAAGTIVQSTATLPKSQTDRTFDELTWRVALEHQMTEDIFGYLSYSRGFKSGIFNSGNPFEPAVNPETLDAYAVGIKSEFFDRTLRLNAEIFYYDYKNIQLSLLEANVTRLLNASSAEVQGGDIELLWAPAIDAGRIELSAVASIIDGEYGKFIGAPGFIPFPGTAIPPNFTNCGPLPANGGNRQCAADMSGAPIIRAPEWSSTLSVNYGYPLEQFGELGFNLSWYHNDGFLWDPDGRIEESPYDLFNAQIALTPAHERWVVKLFGNNLADEEYYTQVAASTQVDSGAPGAPRTYGVEFQYNFNR